MKFLRYFKESNDIANLCEKYNIENWTLNNGVIDVDGDVELVDLNLHFIPIKFGNVNGDFDISDNYIPSLENSPKYVSGSYACSDNVIYSLKYSPLHCSELYASNNILDNLNHMPEVTDFAAFRMCEKLYDISGLTTEDVELTYTPYEHIWNFIKTLNRLSLFYDLRIVDGKTINIEKFKSFALELDDPTALSIGSLGKWWATV